MKVTYHVSTDIPVEERERRVAAAYAILFEETEKRMQGKQKNNLMKTLKFQHQFVKEILKGKKITTWRLSDDKNLKNRDELELIDADSNKGFAKAVITDIQEKKIKELTDNELKNHGYRSLGDMMDSHRGYYGTVNLETKVKIL